MTKPPDRRQLTKPNLIEDSPLSLVICVGLIQRQWQKAFPLRAECFIPEHFKYVRMIMIFPKVVKNCPKVRNKHEVQQKLFILDSAVSAGQMDKLGLIIFDHL